VPGRLLLVDDEPDILETMRQLLAFALPDLLVEAKTNGIDALEALQRERFDVLVTDYRMPGMDGAALSKAAAKRWPKMRILMVTAFKDRETIATIHGVVPHLAIVGKPVEVDDFLEKVRQSLAGERLSGQDDIED
jgi:DNA-binding NtrC family response regulator